MKKEKNIIWVKVNVGVDLPYKKQNKNVGKSKFRVLTLSYKSPLDLISSSINLIFTQSNKAMPSKARVKNNITNTRSLTMKLD